MTFEGELIMSHSHMGGLIIYQNLMLEDFYIPKLSNDMKNRKNHLGGKILYRSLEPSKKTASLII